MRTVFANTATVRRDWYVVDATGQTLGRLASKIAIRLRGKRRAQQGRHQEPAGRVDRQALDDRNRGTGLVARELQDRGRHK